MPSITLCMIVKNEQDFIKQCLDSVKDLVDEIIIIDTGSSDNTLEIAKQFNPKIIKAKWENDFSKPRNISLEHATKDWILVLDADEIISKRDHGEIRRLIKTNEFTGYAFIQRTYSNETSSPRWISAKDDIYEESKNFSGWIISGITRLFKNDKSIRFENPVHETVKNSIERINGKIKKINIPIHHFTKLRQNQKKKLEMYSDLGKKKIIEKPEAKSFMELGIQLHNLGELDEAIVQLKKAINLNPELIRPYINLSQIFIKKGNIKEAIEILEKAIKLQPSHSALLNNLGIAYEKNKEINKAVKCYEKAIEVDEKNIQALNNLSRIYYSAGAIDNVIMLMEKILDVNPKDSITMSNLAGMYLQKKQIDKAVELLEKAHYINPNDTIILLNLSVAYTAKKEYGRAIIAIEKAIKIRPSEQLKKMLENLKKLSTDANT